MKKQKQKSVKESRQRDRVIFVRATSAEYSKIVARASKFPSINAYMLQMALNGKIIERPPSINLEHYRALNQIGNNLNQLTRRVNSSEANIFYKSTKKELEEILANLTALLNASRTEVVKQIR